MDDRYDERANDGVEDEVLDCNALAGTIMALLGSDMSATPARCAHCGATNVMAELRAYVRAPGAVLRCPICHGVVVRVVETSDATYLDIRGAAFLRFARG